MTKLRYAFADDAPPGNWKIDFYDGELYVKDGIVETDSDTRINILLQEGFRFIEEESPQPEEEEQPEEKPQRGRPRKG